MRAPAPIYDSPPIDIPIDIPIEIPCANLKVGATATATGYGDWAYPPSVVVTTTKNNNSLSCGTVFDFDFNLPLPLQVCPRIAATVASELSVARLATPSLDVTVTATRQVGPTSGTSHCGFAFDFNFDMVLPSALPAICPKLDVSTVTNTLTNYKLPPAVNVTATQTSSPGHCGVALDFNFQLPKPAPAICAKLSLAATTTVLTNYRLPPSVNVTGTRISHASHCEFVFDFAFQLPAPAPAICPNVTAHAAATFGVADKPSIYMTTTRTSSPGACGINLDFDFQLPRIFCTTMAANATATYTSAISPTAVVTATNTGATRGSCAYIFDFAFGIPLPTPTCTPVTASPPTVQTVDTLTQPQFQAQSNQTGGGPGGCGVTLDFQFQSPRMLGDNQKYTLVGTSCGGNYLSPVSHAVPIIRSNGTAVARTAEGKTVCVRLDLLDGVTFTGQACYVSELYLQAPSSVGVTPTAKFWNGGPAGHNFEGKLLRAVPAGAAGPVKISLAGGLGVSSINAYNISGYTVQPSVAITARFCDHLQKFDFQPIAPTISGGGGGTLVAGACQTCFNCVRSSLAAVGGCTACGNGATTIYTFNAGPWPAFPQLGGTQTLTYTRGCTWSTSNITVIKSPNTGVYAWILNMNGPASTLQLALISGTDVAGVGS